MEENINKDWKDLFEEGCFVPEEIQEEKLDVLASYNKKYDECLNIPYSLDSAVNYIIVPNVTIIKEYNTSFIELMRIHTHKYHTKRIVPIQIIRGLIDVGAAFMAYINSTDKKEFADKYHKGNKSYDRIAGSSINSLIKLINPQDDFIITLYKNCCNYVHANYLQAKSPSVFHYPIHVGRIGFLGKHYKLKCEDFDNEIKEGLISESQIPFDYEEEVDIIEYCIKVNDMLLDLMEKIQQNDYCSTPK